MRTIDDSLEELFSIDRKPDPSELYYLARYFRDFSSVSRVNSDSLNDRFAIKLDSNQKIKDSEFAIKKYLSGVHVFIFQYEGNLQMHLRYSIDNFSMCNCEDFNYPIASTQFKTTNQYFKDIRKAVLLKDTYGSQIIHGLSHVESYIGFLRNPSHQKMAMLPKILKLE